MFLVPTSSGTEAPLLVRVIVPHCGTPQPPIRATFLGALSVPLALEPEGELAGCSQGVPADCEDL